MTDTKATRRRWLRFSLRTLLIFVLLIGSGALLWRNWEPFAPAFSINEETRIGATGFSPDNKLIFTYKHGRNRENAFAQPPEYEISFYDAETGRLQRTVHGMSSFLEGAPPFASYSPAGKYIYLWSAGASTSVGSVWHIESGKEVPCRSDAFSRQENYAFDAYGTEWIRLPSCKTAGKVHGSDDWNHTLFSSDEKWVATVSNEKLCIANIQNGDVVRELKLEEGVRESAVSPAENVVAVTISPNDEKLKDKTLLLDIPGGSVVGEFQGGLTYYTFSKNGKFLLTHDGAVCVWDVAAKKLCGRFDVDAFSQLSPSGDRLLCSKPLKLSAWDVQTHRELWRTEADGSFTPDGEFVRLYGAPNDVISAQTGKLLWRLDEWRWPKEKLQSYSTLENPGDFLKLLSLRSEGDGESHRATVWRQRRLFAWYGFAWLPEFWTLVVLAAAFVWSIWRDRH